MRYSTQNRVQKKSTPEKLFGEHSRRISAETGSPLASWGRSKPKKVRKLHIILVTSFHSSHLFRDLIIAFILPRQIIK